MQQWDQRIDLLPTADGDEFLEEEMEDRGDRGGDGDADYFGDDCARYTARLEKQYRCERPAWSTWLTDRIVKVPGKLLAEPGAYVLVAEANGQKSCAPLVVDALDLTMRRCRDGVFALVSHPVKDRAATPAAGARILSPQMVGTAVTDAQGGLRQGVCRRRSADSGGLWRAFCHRRVWTAFRRHLLQPV